MHGIERRENLRWHLESVRLREEKRVIRLWIDVDANDIEAGSMVANCCAASTAKQIQEHRFRHSSSR